MTDSKTIAFFPEAAFGPALNSVGIAQACTDLGHKAIFLTDPGMGGVYKGYGFEEYTVNMSEPMPPEEMAKYWTDFINGHIPNFRKTPLEQIDNYVKECWDAIVDTAKWAQKDLPAVLEKTRPDVICVDNVVLFPAIKQWGAPWVRIISCSENEIEDPDIPPHLSGCGESDRACFDLYRARFSESIGDIHADFNNFLAECGEAPYPLGQFFEASPHLNLLLYPSAVRFRRRKPLTAPQFHYLDGCVRREEPYQIPDFKCGSEDPLIYVSFGSLGAGDVELLKRLVDTLATMPVRGLVNVGDYGDDYPPPPDNIILASWFPQPSVIPQMDLVIHHGGNNSFTECLYFGKPAIIMPYVWDGHDNATRVQETGYGRKMSRYDWTADELRQTVQSMLDDDKMRRRLQETSRQMQAESGPQKAARLLDALARGA